MVEKGWGYMTQEQYFKNLTVPSGKVDVVIDTDAYNEIDDQYAICYALKSKHKLSVKGITAAPFLDSNDSPPADGMNKSYDEIIKLLDLMGESELKDIVYKGSQEFLPNEATAVESDAADFIANLAENYSPESPLYIVAIGAITNVASAILKNPKIKENCVVVWLGGHGTHIPFAASEFNMVQDIAAARIVFGSGVPLVLLPCKGVVDHFATSKYELEHWLSGKNPLCDYLCENTIRYMEETKKGKPWSKPIWDVTAVAWLLNDGSKFMRERLISCPIPEYDKCYSLDQDRHFIKYVYQIKRDLLFEDLFRMLSE